MAPTSNNLQSSIALALAGMTESVNIPKPRLVDPAKETYAHIAAKSAPVQNKTGGLPTPPNSISPSLPPQRSTFSGQHSPPAIAHLDSDIDLDDAVEHAKAQDSPQKGLTARRLQNLEGPDAFGDITPFMLAKHHLPGILVQHGPLAIRHIMGYLTTSVPGFSGMPPAKARRLVVAALEGRGDDGQVGGLNSQVIFEKVGWGRWSARKRGQMLRHRFKSAAVGLQIPQGHRQQDRTPYGSRQSDHQAFSPSEHQTMAQHEADKMSLDGERETPAQDDLDLTDEEDWASMGAAALREGSCPLTGKRRQYQPYIDPKSRGRGITKRPSSNFAKSLPSSSVLYGKQQQFLKAQAAPKESMDFSTFMSNNKDFGSQDREAVEALLKMSSV